MDGLTRHARLRSAQRGIRPAWIEAAVAFGDRRHSHGDMVYELRDRSLLGTPYEKQADRLRGLAVVLTPDGDVRTVMWNYRIRNRPGMLGRRRRGGRRGDAPGGLPFGYPA